MLQSIRTVRCINLFSSATVLQRTGVLKVDTAGSPVRALLVSDVQRPNSIANYRATRVGRSTSYLDPSLDLGFGISSPNNNVSPGQLSVSRQPCSTAVFVLVLKHLIVLILVQSAVISICLKKFAEVSRVQYSMLRFQFNLGRTLRFRNPKNLSIVGS